MNTRRVFALAFFSAIIVIMLGAILYVAHFSSANSEVVYVLKNNVQAGSPFSLNDLQRVQISSDVNIFDGAVKDANIGNFTSKSRYATSLSAKDILRSDDLVDNSAVSDVALQIVTAPVLATGDKVDVYANLTDSSGSAQTVLIGRSLTVINTGSPFVIEVNRTDEAYWIALSSNKNAQVTVARSSPVPLNNAPSSSTSNNAICQLAQNPDQVGPSPGSSPLSLPPPPGC